MSYKHAESIMAIPTDKLMLADIVEGFNSVNRISQKVFYEVLDEHLVFAQRRGLETNEAYRQILPYTVLSYRDDHGVTWYAVYQRAKGIGESRLLGKCSIGFGGHLDISDIYTLNYMGLDEPNATSIVSTRQTVVESLRREIQEEVPTAKWDGIYFKGVINDTSDAVGRVHLGVVNVMELTEPVKELGEVELEFIGMMTLDQLRVSHLDFENWSKILIETME